MQGLIESYAARELKSYPSARTSKRIYRRYGQTMLAVAIPALLSGLIAGFVMSGGEKDTAPTLDLAQRAEMLRYAQSKIVTLPAPNGTQLDTVQVQTSAVHAPVSNLDEISQ